MNNLWIIKNIWWNLDLKKFVLDPATRCYKKLKGRFTLFEAGRECENEDAKLALPRNERENEFLVGFLFLS